MEELTFDVGAQGKTSAAIFRAAKPKEATLILAHGAGAPRTHAFMLDVAQRIATEGIDVVTFNFLYAEAGRRMPDRVELLEACWRAAIAMVRARGGVPTERLFIGGKSMGGRIATHIAATKDSLLLSGVVCLGYPLHPIQKPKVVRREILDVEIPMLVVQGTRDELGTAAEMKKLLSSKPNAVLHVVRGADHALAKTDEVARAVASFICPPSPSKRSR